MDVIERIEQLRKERGWTKYRLAEEALLNPSTLDSMYARNTPPKIDILKMICEGFGITLAQFFIEDEEIEAVSKVEKELLNNFRKLSAEKKKAIFNLIND